MLHTVHIDSLALFLTFWVKELNEGASNFGTMQDTRGKPLQRDIQNPQIEYVKQQTTTTAR